MYFRSLALITSCLLAPAVVFGADAASAPLEISGLIVSAGGAPGAGRAALVPLPGNYAWHRAVLAGRAIPEAVAAVDADGDGRFVLTAPTVGMWTVVVRDAGRVPMRYLPLPVTEPIELPPLELVPDAGVEILVRGSDGHPVDAWVLLTTGSPELVQALRTDGWQINTRIGRTDAEGRVRLPRIAGEALKVHAYASDGRATAAIPGDSARAELILGPAAEGPSVEVREASGRPASAVVVSEGSPAWPSGVTDREGRLSLPVAGKGPFDFLLPDGRRHRIESLSNPARIELPTARPIQGKVLEAATHRPLAWALVWPGDDPGNVTYTDAKGTYSVAARAGGRVWVQAEARGFQPRAVTLPRTADATQLPTIALEPATTLAGRVVDAAGAPIARVVVTAAAGRGKDEVFHPDRAASRALSDSEGRFVLRGLAAAASYDLSARRYGYRAAQATVAANSEIRLVLERARSARGVAVDSQGRPLSGVEVTIRSSAGAADAVTALSNDHGRFEVRELPADRVDLEARRQGYAPAILRGVVIAPGTGPAELGALTLVPGARIEGRVADAAGRPLAGAEVRWAEADRLPNHVLAAKLRPQKPAAVSDESGRFAIPDLARGRSVNVLLVREGYLPAWVAGVEAPTAKPLTVVLEPASRIRGWVEADSGEPLPGAEVRLRPASPPPGTVGVEPRRSENEADVDAGGDGTFAFSEVAPGAVTLEASVEGFLPADPVELQVPPKGGVRDVRLVLSRGASVIGWVGTARGEPVAGARLRIGSIQGESDAEGRYRLAGVPLGLKALVLSHPAYKAKIREVDVQPGENRVDVTVEQGASVAGRVVDESGLPRIGAAVTLRNRGERGPRGYRGSSGAGGRFEILGVADGRFDLEVSADGFAPTVHPTLVEVAGGDVDGLEVVLRRGATLFGRIRGVEPERIAEIEVSAERDGRPSRSGTVDHTGRYEIAALEAGDWHLRARLSGGRREADAWVAIAPGDREVERDLKVGGGLALDGLVLLEDRPLPQSQVSLRGVDVTVERGVTTDHRGAFRIEDLEPGRYRVEVVNGERMLSHTEEVELTADRQVVIDVATAVVSGTVVAAGSGEGVAEALIYLQRLFGGTEPGPLTTVGTNAAGSFVTASLAPGRYRLTVRGDGYAPEERIVDAEAGVPAEPLRIELEPTAGLALTVLRAAGQPPQWATVVVLDEAGRPIHAEESRLSDHGHGYLKQVPPGHWTVLVKAAGSPAALATATVPGEELQVKLSTAATLTVRVPALAESRMAANLTLAGPDGSPYFAVNPGGSFQHAWPLAGGVVTVADMPAGAWQLKVTAADGRVWSASATTRGDSAVAAVIE